MTRGGRYCDPDRDSCEPGQDQCKPVPATEKPTDDIDEDFDNLDWSAVLSGKVKPGDRPRRSADGDCAPDERMCILR